MRELEGLTDKTVQQAPHTFSEDLTPPSSSDNGQDEPPPLPGLLSGGIMDENVEIEVMLILILSSRSTSTNAK